MVDPRLKLVLGGPGCGKTTELLRIISNELDSGVHPSEIAFVAFTNAAADEARLRAAAQFGLTPEDLPWFRTIHSLAYRQLGITKDEVMSGRDWSEFAELVGEEISGTYDPTEPFSGGSSRRKGDMLLRVVDYAATTMGSIVDVWNSLDEPVPWHELKRFDAAFARYKLDSAKMDFTDMLLSYVNEGEPLNVRVAVVDEAQDLTRSQWAAVHRAFSNAERIYVGGDDDQAIYRWAGADVDTFLTLSTSPHILTHSHRLPRRVHALAEQVAQRIGKRYVKTFSPDNREGEVNWHMTLDSVDLVDGTWLLLARNGYMLKRLEAMVREQGLNYRTREGSAVAPEDLKAILLWERLRSGKQEDMGAGEVRTLFKALDRPIPQLKELNRYRPEELGLEVVRIWHQALEGIPLVRRDFYVACLRRGEKLTAEPRVRIETIHGVKGAEADHVLLMTDLSQRTHQGFDADPDNEHRVFYVGVTRARNTLHIVNPQSDRSYPV